MRATDMEPTAGFHDLLLRAQAGDRAAMDRILSILRPHMERLARSYADPRHPDESASDLVQEAELRAWQKLELFQGGPNDAETEAKLRGWLGQIVHRLGLNAQRDRQAQKRSPEGGRVVSLHRESDANASAHTMDVEDSGPTASKLAREDEEAQLVHRALEKIEEPTSRAIIRLYFFEGLSQREIADELGISHDSVRHKYRTALEQLERELEDLT